MAETATAPTTTTATTTTMDPQIIQLKNYLQTIITKQEELKKRIELKHDKAVTARRLSTSTVAKQTSLRNVMIDVEDSQSHHHTVEVVETPGMEQRLHDYADNVEELEKELQETTKLVNEVALALQSVLQ